MTEMRRTIPATLEALEAFLAEFRGRCECLKKLSDRFDAELLFREVLTNAVLHGCHGDPCRQVLCAVRLSDRRVSIAVQDDGDGFDWRRPATGTGDLRLSGRGLEILRRYASRIRFNRKGNAATVIKRFGETGKS